MVYVLLSIQMIVFFLAMIEERIQRYVKPIYLCLGIMLIMLVGLRPLGIDSDSENYEYYYSHYDDDTIMFTVEYSFKLFAEILNSFTSDVHAIFLLYAFLAISIKFFAFRKLSLNSFFLPIVVYMGDYFIMHEMTQIRAGVVSSLVLLCCAAIVEGQKKKALLIVCACCFFHYSAISLFPLLFISGKNMSQKSRGLWALVIPVAYLIYFSGFNPLIDISIPYIGDKLQAYQVMKDKGMIGEHINVFNAVLMVIVLAYYYNLYFYDTIYKYNKNLPIILKTTAISVFSFVFLSFLPVLAYRVYALYGITSILLFTNIYYTIKPLWLGKTVVGVVGITLFMINVFFTKLLAH